MMIELYDKVKIKKRDVTGRVVSIDDNHGKDELIYYVEIEDKYKTGEFLEDLVWCERDEIELVEKIFS